MGDDDYTGGAGAVLFGQEIAAEDRFDTEELPIVEGHGFGEDALGSVAAGEGDGVEAVSGGVLQGGGAVLVIGEIGGGDGHASGAGLFPQCEQALRVAVREAAEHDGMDDAEDRSVDAEAEGEGENGDSGEAGGLAEGAEAVPYILHQLFERDPPPQVDAGLLEGCAVSESPPGSVEIAEFAGAEVQVKAHFFVEILDEAVLMKEMGETPADFAETHGSSHYAG